MLLRRTSTSYMVALIVERLGASRIAGACQQARIHTIRFFTQFLDGGSLFAISFRAPSPLPYSILFLRVVTSD